MKIIVNSKIRIVNPTPTIEKWCREHLILDNPDYYKLERMGKWTGNTPKDVWLFEKDGGDLILPFGCLRAVWQMCCRAVSWEVQIAPIRRLNYKSNINLYPYQEKAVNEAISKKNGILVMPCGSGKTQSGLEIIARLGGKALWLTHTQDLLRQSKERAESVLDDVGLGTITAGKIDIGTHITFATVQTMAKINLSEYRDCFDVIIVDECQHCCGTPTKVTQFFKVVSSLSARYKIGLTATPKRADGLEQAMFCLLGDTIHEVSREEVKDTTCPIKVSVIETGWMPDYRCVLLGDGTIDYNKIIDNMIEDQNRFDVIVRGLEGLRGEPSIVLANRVAYLERLCTEFNASGKYRGVCISGAGASKKAKEERKKALAALNSGEINCIFATYQLAKEGLDVPNLRYVLFATPEKDHTTVQQAAGRVGRKAKGKECGYVLDFVDEFGMYKKWMHERYLVYKKIDAEVGY